MKRTFGMILAALVAAAVFAGLVHTVLVAAHVSQRLQACITALKEVGLPFRNEMEAGTGGKQIQIEDPDGNPIELFEPAG